MISLLGWTNLLIGFEGLQFNEIYLFMLSCHFECGGVVSLGHSV